MAETPVILIGALPVGSARDFSAYASTNAQNAGGGMPSPGGPTQVVSPPYTQPMWFYNAEPRIPFNQDFPQNLPRPSWKGGRGGPASGGSPITSALGAVTMTKGVGDTVGAWVMNPGIVTLRLLGAGFAGYHGFKRNHDSVGWGAWWAFLGALSPFLTNGVAVVEGYAQKTRGEL
jgi:hypothetical protein